MTVIFYVLSLQLQLARNKEYQVEAPPRSLRRRDFIAAGLGGAFVLGTQLTPAGMAAPVTTGDEVGSPSATGIVTDVKVPSPGTFVLTLSVAAAFGDLWKAEPDVVVTVDPSSRYLDWRDRNIAGARIEPQVGDAFACAGVLDSNGHIRVRRAYLNLVDVAISIASKQLDTAGIGILTASNRAATPGGVRLARQTVVAEGYEAASQGRFLPAIAVADKLIPGGLVLARGTRRPGDAVLEAGELILLPSHAQAVALIP